MAVTLAVYGWIMDTIVGDGASENRSAFKKLATISAHEIFDRRFPPEVLDGLPLAFKIGFEHPSPMYRKNVTIVIGGEMPHWVKKFRNAFDNKSRTLIYRKKEMNLSMIYDVWRASGDSDVFAGSFVRKYNKTHDHFNLNAYLKMRVFLAVQIPSQNTITMLKAESGNDEQYAPMIELFEAVDRLVDIMNGTGYKNGKNKNVGLINTPTHHHMIELFGILQTFEGWKLECGGFTKAFITQQTYEDLVWMVFGVVAIGSLYLDEDGKHTMHQGRSGSDVCEHFFAMIRYINSNPTMQQCREGASRAASNVSSSMFSKKAGSNAAGATTEAADYFAPLAPPKKKHKK